MENQPSPILNWAFFSQGKSMDELRQWLLLTTMELENTRARAYEDLRMREAQILQLKEMLNRAMKEKRDAEEKCQRLFYEKRLLLQSSASHPLSSGVSTVDDEPRSTAAAGFSSDSDGSMVSSPAAVVEYPVVFDKPLPEKGRFLQAVMKAGPLLQTLLLAGPLPQWRHPPPPMDTFQIPTPPVNYHNPPPAAAIFPDSHLHLHHQDSLLEIAAHNSNSNCGRINRKRGIFDESEYSMEPNKYQRAVL
ncbi:unnamed protein product [Cuscuta campestris]|uniref:Uncharacterized protein n=1 Tax=Cuscuta campestris TaxID=132261 RepID=A0A484KIW6_9ASTE|nr:unnamed protein product [Cuscuta campestris]